MKRRTVTTVTLERLVDHKLSSPGKSEFLDLVKKKTDAAVKSFYDEFAHAAAYTLWNGSKVVADPSLPNDTAYVVSNKTYKFVGGAKHVTIASDNYAKISFDAWEASTKATGQIRPSMPTDKEISDELCRELRRLHPGVELCKAKTSGPHICIKSDAARAFLRDKVYGKATVAHEAVMAGDVIGEVRGACFEVARLLAKLIKETIDERVKGWGPPHGASVEYSTALAMLAPTPVVVRFASVNAAHVMASYDDGSQFAYFDHQSDAVCWRIASYFTVTPPGEEVGE